MPDHKRCKLIVGHGDSNTSSSLYSDEVYKNAVRKYQCAGVEGMLQYCEQEDIRLDEARGGQNRHNDALTRFHRSAGMGGGLSRVYGPGMGGLFPVTRAMAHGFGNALIDLTRAAGEFVRNIIRAARAFLRGLKESLKQKLTANDFKTFAFKLAESSVVTVVFPLVFGAGAVAGVVKDVVDTVKGIVDLATNIEEIAKGAYEFVKGVLSDPSMAYDLGKVVGQEMAKSFKTLVGRNTVRFTFELGKIVGPFIIYSLLAFFGFPQVAMLRVGAWVGKFLAKFPKLAKIVNKMARLIPGRKGFVLYGRATKGYIRDSGITRAHFDGFKATAKEQNVIVVVRNTNPKSLDLIERHKCPPKAKNLEGIASTKTSDQGIVMAEDINAVRSRGYAVVDDDLIARTADGRKIDLPSKFWKVEKGQVIDVDTKKPVVGDYDLMGVIDPDAPGRNIALVASNGETVADVSSPIVRRVKDAVNNRFDRPRVLHGAQDQYAGFRGGATVIYPDGHATFLPDEAAVRAFYDSPSIMRQTRTGKYANTGQRPDFDENGRYENIILGPWKPSANDQ